MSDQVFLAMAVVGTFVAVVLARLAWVVTTRERRPSAVLQGQLQSAGIALPGQADARFTERIVAPTVSGLAGLASRITPSGARDKLAEKLVLAGSPNGWTAERVLAVKGMGLLLGLFLGYLVGSFVSITVIRIAAAPVVAMIGYLVPGAVLSQAVIARQDQIARTLSDTIDLLTISVEAGLSFDAALLHARRTMKGPLSEEIGRLLHEVQLGVSRSDALRHLSDRTKVPELKGFVLAMVQADVFGVSVANVLRAQSQELRTKRRQRAEERAMKIPVKLLFPMIFCVMPALFIVIVGPAALEIIRAIRDGTLF